MKSVEQKVIKFIQTHSLIESGDRILVAFSGGPDSVFLLQFINKFKKKYQITLSAFHLNHMLRKDADKEQKFCEKICSELNIPFYSNKTDVKSFAKQKKLSLEEAGREIRYRELYKYSEKYNFNKIATAHIADDNAETVLLNLFKGTGLKGISGIPVKRNNIIRPILCLTKKEILGYLKSANLKFALDKSNLDTVYDRNFIRLKIIPEIEKKLNPNLKNSVLNTSINLQSHYGLIEKLIAELELKYCKQADEEIRIIKNLFTESDKFLTSELLRKVITEKFRVTVEQKDIQKIFSVSQKQTGSTESLKNNIKIISDRQFIVLFRSRPEKTNSIRIKLDEKKKFNSHFLSISEAGKKDVVISNNKKVEFVDGELTGKNFVIRKWKNGDKFHPIGMKGTKKLSDYLNDIKIDAKEKKNCYVLTSNNRIVWVIGERLDERFKLRPETKIIYKLELTDE